MVGVGAGGVISRRALLKGVGGVALLGAGAGLVRAIDQGLVLAPDRPGLAAWEDWRQERYQGPLALVSAGVLAASPHNTQPWRFAVGRLGVDVFEVPERSLGAMDPFGRERLIGLGAAIHNMALAASRIGRAAAVSVLPDTANPLHVARIELGPEGERAPPHPLLGAIGQRHTHRGGWTGEPLAEAVLARVRSFPLAPGLAIPMFAAGSPRGAAFAALTRDATAAIVADAEMSADGHAWFRHSRRDQDAHMDGIGIATAGLSPALAFGGAMLPAQTAAESGRFWLAATTDTALPTASAFGLITLADPWDRRGALLAGMAWQRLHLQATALGLVVQPLNQLPEMIDRERQLGRPAGFARAADVLLDDPAQRPTFAFRIGKAEAVALPSPRRPVSRVIGAPARIGYDIDRARAETLAQDAALAARPKP
jgi:nitroreductase